MNVVDMTFGSYADRTWHWIEAAFEATPWARTGLMIAAIVAVLLCFPVSRLLKSNVFVVAGLLFAWGAVAAFTLTPIPENIAITQGCIYDIFRPSRADLTEPTDISMNMLMLLPVGVLLTWLRPWWAVMGAIVAGIATPFVVEYTQRVVVELGRQCSFYDIATNLLGLGVGIVLGFAIRIVWMIGAAIAGRLAR